MIDYTLIGYTQCYFCGEELLPVEKYWILSTVCCLDCAEDYVRVDFGLAGWLEEGR